MGKDIICLYTSTCPIYKNWLDNTKMSAEAVNVIYKTAEPKYRCLAIVNAEGGNIGDYLKKKLGDIIPQQITCPQIEILNQLERIVSGKEK